MGFAIGKGAPSNKQNHSSLRDRAVQQLHRGNVEDDGQPTMLGKGLEKLCGELYPNIFYFLFSFTVLLFARDPMAQDLSDGLSYQNLGSAVRIVHETPSLRSPQKNITAIS